MVDRMTAQPVFVFFLTTLDSTRSSNMLPLTSCRLGPDGLPPHPSALLWLWFQKQATRPDLSTGSMQPPGGRQCQSLSTFLPKFRLPVQMKNFAEPRRPTRKVPGRLGKSAHS